MPSMRRGCSVFAVALALVAFLPQAGAAHEETHPVAGSKLSMSDPPGKPYKRKFSFKTKKQLSVYDVTADLTTEPANLIVRGTGTGDGSSGVIRLDGAGWKGIGRSDDLKGWKYKGDWRSPASAGLSKIMIKKSSKGGKLVLKAKGGHWPYAIVSAQGSIELSLLLGDEQYCAEFTGFLKNQGGKVVAKNATAPAGCPAVCGNGRLELGEQCDDGNDIDGDTCSNDCQGCAGEAEYATTYEGIQALVFDSAVYACSNDICHGSAAQGGLDLRAGVSHAGLVAVASQIDPATLRVYPGDEDRSLLYGKVAAKTLGGPAVPGSPMPANAATVSADLLEAMRLWIRAGAPADGVVAGTAELFDACLPEPGPNQMPRPAPPPTGEGLQFAQPGYLLPAQSETELCVATYYDASDAVSVPAAYRFPCPAGQFTGSNDSGVCFGFNSTEIALDPQSHHAIIDVYRGSAGASDAGWGQWRCYGGTGDGQSCDAVAAAADPSLCDEGVCGSAAVPGSGCTGFGPPDLPTKRSNLALTQEATFSNTMYPGAYDIMPLKGVIVWNSHAFNLTSTDTDMNVWLNVSFTDDTQFQQNTLLDSRFIFTQNVPVFEQREYCGTLTLPLNAAVVLVTSHTHKRGKRFRMYAPPQVPCGNQGGGQADPACTPGDASDVFYESMDYADPLVLRWGPDNDPPFDEVPVLSGGTNSRTVKFCSLYDNGATDPAEVKQQSTSPEPPPGGVGGPCSDSQVKCMDGANKGQLCGGYDANCPGSICDACDLHGGSTSDDEMFIPAFIYFIAG